MDMKPLDQTWARNISHRFAELYKSKTAHDLNLIWGDTAVKSHMLVLCANSPVLEEEIKSTLKFKVSGLPSVLIDGFDEKDAGVILPRLYCGIIEVTEDNYKTLYKFSIIYKVEWMTKRIVDFLEINAVNFYQLVIFAEKMCQMDNGHLKRICLLSVENSSDITALCECLFAERDKIAAVPNSTIIKICENKNYGDKDCLKVLGHVLDWFELSVPPTSTYDSVVGVITEQFDLFLIFSSPLYSRYCDVVQHKCSIEISRFASGHYLWTFTAYLENVKKWTADDLWKTASLPLHQNNFRWTQFSPHEIIAILKTLRFENELVKIIPCPYFWTGLLSTWLFGKDLGSTVQGYVISEFVKLIKSCRGLTHGYIMNCFMLLCPKWHIDVKEYFRTITYADNNVDFPFYGVFTLPSTDQSNNLEELIKLELKAETPRDRFCVTNNQQLRGQENQGIEDCEDCRTLCFCCRSMQCMGCVLFANIDRENYCFVKYRHGSNKTPFLIRPADDIYAADGHFPASSVQMVYKGQFYPLTFTHPDLFEKIVEESRSSNLINMDKTIESTDVLFYVTLSSGISSYWKDFQHNDNSIYNSK